MFETVRLNPGTQSFLAVKETIVSLRETYQGLITVALPTTTAAIFFRKQLEAELGKFWGVRFYAHSDILSLIQDISENEFSFKKSNHLNNISDLKTIADEVFDGESSWMKISLVESTLKLLNGIGFKQLALLEKVNPVAFHIAQEFQRLKGTFVSEVVDISESMTTIFGKMILVYHNEIPGVQELILNKCSSVVINTVELATNKEYSYVESFVFDNAFDEANAIIDMALDAAADVPLSEMAIVLPNDAAKRLFIACAKSKNIPVAGSEVYDAYDDQVILAARHLLSSKNSFVNEFYIKDFYNRFSWLDSKTKYRDDDLKAVIKKMHFADTLSEYFIAIYSFIEKGYATLKSSLDEAQVELVDSQFSIVKQLTELDETISPIEAEFLLKRLCSSITSRIGTLGNGIYLCRPTEIIGSSFKKLFIVSLNVEYLKEETPRNSVLTNFDIETLGLNSGDALRTRETNNTIMNWLFNCSDEVFISTCKIDSQGKTLLQSIEFEKIFETAQRIENVSINDTALSKVEDFTQGAEYIEEFFSRNLNDKNVLINTDSITTYSASSFETLAKCPFRFFITKALNTSDKKENDDIDFVTALDRGSIIHEVLEKEGLDKFDPDNLSMLVNEKISELIHTGVIPSETSGVLNKIEIMDLLQTAVALHKQKMEAGYSLYSVEEKIEGSFETAHGPINIRGKIDRIDVSNESKFSIVDYKTGKYEPKSDFFDFGKRLQLGLYAILLEEKLNITSLEYWYLRKNPKELFERISLNDEEMLNIKHTVSEIISVISTGVVAPRNYSFSQRRGSTKDGPITEEDNCSSCEVANICYKDHQEMWKSIELQKKTFQYRLATHDLDESELS